MPFLQKNVICDGSACQNQSYLNDRGLHFFLSTQTPVTTHATYRQPRKREREEKIQEEGGDGGFDTGTVQCQCAADAITAGTQCAARHGGEEADEGAAGRPLALGLPAFIPTPALSSHPIRTLSVSPFILSLSLFLSFFRFEMHMCTLTLTGILPRLY